MIKKLEEVIIFLKKHYIMTFLVIVDILVGIFHFDIPCTILTLLIAIYIVAKDVGQNSLASFHALTLGYSISIVLISVAMLLTIKIVSISPGENMKSLIAQAIYFFDIGHDVIILVTVVSIILLPQVGSFILGAIVGYASDIKYVSTSINIFMWGFIKALLTASSLFMTLYIFNLFENWTKDKEASLIFIASLGLLFMSLILTYFHVVIIQGNKYIANLRIPDKIKKIARRNISLEQTSENNQLEPVRDLQMLWNKYSDKHIV